MIELDVISEFIKECGWHVRPEWDQSVIGGIFWTLADGRYLPDDYDERWHGDGPINYEYIVSVVKGESIVIGSRHRVDNPDFMGELADHRLFDKMRVALESIYDD